MALVYIWWCNVCVCSSLQHLHEINEAMRGVDRTPGSKVKRKLTMLEASPYTSGPTKRVRVEVSPCDYCPPPNLWFGALLPFYIGRFVCIHLHMWCFIYTRGRISNVQPKLELGIVCDGMGRIVNRPSFHTIFPLQYTKQNLQSLFYPELCPFINNLWQPLSLI